MFIVDDDRRICEALAELLSTFDLHVVTFNSAAHYLAHPKPDAPACLLLDVQLPDINGFEVANRLTENGSSPAIVLTSSRDVEDLGYLAGRDGVRGFIPKSELSGPALEALL